MIIAHIFYKVSGIMQNGKTFKRKFVLKIIHATCSNPTNLSCFFKYYIVTLPQLKIKIHLRHDKKTM